MQSCGDVAVFPFIGLNGVPFLVAWFSWRTFLDSHFFSVSCLLASMALIPTALFPFYFPLLYSVSRLLGAFFRRWSDPAEAFSNLFAFKRLLGGEGRLPVFSQPLSFRDELLFF